MRSVLTVVTSCPANTQIDPQDRSIVHPRVISSARTLVLRFGALRDGARFSFMPVTHQNLNARLARWARRTLVDPLWARAVRLLEYDFRRRQQRLIVYHHLGLGDHFICRGLVLELADRYVDGQVIVPVKRPYIGTVKALYGDDPRIETLPVDWPHADRDVYTFAKNARLKIIRIGFEQFQPKEWDRSFYRQFEVDMAVSWSRFTPPKPITESRLLFERNVNAQPYALVHAEASFGALGLDIGSDLPTVSVRAQNADAGLLAWWDVIENAAQIHCIDSSVAHLVDRLPTVPGQQLYLHDARGSGCTFVRRKDWTFVPYPHTRP